MYLTNECSIELLCRKDLIPFENAKIAFVDEIFAIEKPGTQLNVHGLASGNSAVDVQQPLSELSCVAVTKFARHYCCHLSVWLAVHCDCIFTQ